MRCGGWRVGLGFKLKGWFKGFGMWVVGRCGLPCWSWGLPLKLLGFHRFGF